METILDHVTIYLDCSSTDPNLRIFRTRDAYLESLAADLKSFSAYSCQNTKWYEAKTLPNLG